ncbi:GNAT family N-acetyltransferase [Paenibacillus sp. GCM10023252]|uniref:GNAT family N-acetyltransferase n=1 Tax=Paenibacillus sp. GCM10023252 TaxID=3252649 RepID=UPI00360EB70D
MMKTSRLQLRTLSRTDAPAVLEYVLRNRHFLQDWEPAREDAYYTLESQEELLEQDSAATASGQLWKGWIVHPDNPEIILGSVALSNIVRGIFLSCHLGYRLDQHALNQGYMTEALEAAIRYAFDELKLHRIEANIMPRNTASLRVVQKLGFQEEGIARSYLYINGKWEDHIHMVLLNEALEMKGGQQP